MFSTVLGSLVLLAHQCWEVSKETDQKTMTEELRRCLVQSLDRDSCFPLQDSGNLSDQLVAAGGSHGGGKASLPQEVWATVVLVTFSAFFTKAELEGKPRLRYSDGSVLLQLKVVTASTWPETHSWKKEESSLLWRSVWWYGHV